MKLSNIGTVHTAYREAKESNRIPDEERVLLLELIRVIILSQSDSGVTYKDLDSDWKLPESLSRRT
jgi:hypothetical protein